jgi:hypothetical protein
MYSLGENSLVEGLGNWRPMRPPAQTKRRKMVDEERRRTDKTFSEEDIEHFALKIIGEDLPHNPGISDDRLEQWLKRARRRIEVHGDWLKPEDERVPGNNIRLTKEELLFL